METKNNIEQFDEDKFLSSIPKKNNFSVPTDYFEFLPEQIMNKVQKKKKKKKKEIYFLFRPVIAIPSLAVLSGIIVLLFFFYNKETNSANNILLSENEVQNVINNPELYNIDEASITEEYLAANISSESVNEESTTSEEEIKSYLEENSDVATMTKENE